RDRVELVARVVESLAVVRKERYSLGMQRNWCILILHRVTLQRAHFCTGKVNVAYGNGFAVEVCLYFGRPCIFYDDDRVRQRNVHNSAMTIEVHVAGILYLACGAIPLAPSSSLWEGKDTVTTYLFCPTRRRNLAIGNGADHVLTETFPHAPLQGAFHTAG